MGPALERVVCYARAAFVDLRIFLAGKGDPEIPPLRLQFVGLGDFRAIGRHLLDLTVTRARLEPHSHMLDIGCGSGRLALPLTGYLHAGEYEGFDVVPSAIRWCKRHIAQRHSNFHFRHVSLKNSHYSFRGSSASRFVFPYRDSHFDAVVAYSLFTHLRFEEIRTYVHQTYRVLKPGGRFVATYFLLNERSEAAQRSLPAVEQFPYTDGPVSYASESDPALAVAILETALLKVLREAGFRDIAVEAGGWYGVQNIASFQDLVSCQK